VKRLALLCVLIACAAPASAAQGAAPLIDAAALVAYAHGNGTISGSTDFGSAVQAFCAPDISYVAWYVDNTKRWGWTPGDYDSRLVPYTHRAAIGKDRTFTCQGLAPGRYLVWVEGYTPGFGGGDSSTLTETRTKEDSISGQVSQYDVRYVVVGSGSELELVGPEHVIVAGSGTTNVRL